MFPSSIFTAEFLNYVSFPREKEAAIGRPELPVQAPFGAWFGTFSHLQSLLFYKPHDTSDSANQMEPDHPKLQGHSRLQMSCAHQGKKLPLQCQGQ